MSRHNDALGNPVGAAASATARQHYDDALSLLQCYRGDPVAAIDRARADSPGFAMAHALHAWLHLLGTEPAGFAVARADLDLARACATTERERGHLAAIEQLLDGRWQSAARTLEDVAIAWPRDALALQAGHTLDFFLGDSRMLRDRIARALPEWSPDMPGFHALLGMHAFGLEECGLYARAEAAGRRAVELEPRDAWAQHAVAHVLEMQGRRREGIRWMREREAHWAPESFFAVHNWWHLALYHLDLGDVGEVLALFDGPIDGQRSSLVLDLVDASAMLWRLQLRGVDVGDRWASLADRWAPVAAAGSFAFNDVHAMMAFASAGQRERVEALHAAQRQALQVADDNAAALRDVGRPVTLAIEAFVAGDAPRAVEWLRPVRNRAHRFGGSHAQRDLIDQTLIEAARRAGERALERALRAERDDVRGYSMVLETGGGRRLSMPSRV